MSTNTTSKWVEERKKRHMHLKLKILETLALSKPPQVTCPKIHEERMDCTPSKDKTSWNHAYKPHQNYGKMRTNRILQVRAQEMYFASQRLQHYRDCKRKQKTKALNHLKGVWKKDQQHRITSLENEFFESQRKKNMALLVQLNWAARQRACATKKEHERHHWHIHCFEMAMQKERFLRHMKRKLETTNINRRKLVTKIISIMERDLVHQYHHKQKPKKEMENNDSRVCQTIYPRPTTIQDLKAIKLFSNMANCLMDFKNTHLHSHTSMSKECLSNPFTHVVKKLNQEYVNGWHAAQIECQRIKLIQEDKTQQKKINEQRVVDRSHVAIFKTIVEEKNKKLLEQQKTCGCKLNFGFPHKNLPCPRCKNGIKKFESKDDRLKVAQKSNTMGKLQIYVDCSRHGEGCNISWT